MSRGPGRVQRAILAALDEQPVGPFLGWVSVAGLTRALYGEHASRSQQESVRRACKALAYSGAVETALQAETVAIRSARVASGDWLTYRGQHRADRAQLCVRLGLSVEAEAAEKQFLDDVVNRAAVLDRLIDQADRRAAR